MTEQERRAKATYDFAVRLAEATVKHAKDPKKRAEAAARLAELRTFSEYK